MGGAKCGDRFTGQIGGRGDQWLKHELTHLLVFGTQSAQGSTAEGLNCNSLHRSAAFFEEKEGGTVAAHESPEKINI